MSKQLDKIYENFLEGTCKKFNVPQEAECLLKEGFARYSAMCEAEEAEVEKFRKKPVSVDAIEWTGDNFDDIKDFAGDKVKIKDGELIVVTPEDGKKTKAEHVATKGDYVIRGVKGEFYFCKPDIFRKTYSPA